MRGTIINGNIMLVGIPEWTRTLGRQDAEEW